MPTIIIEGPPIDVDKKRALVKQMTETASDVYELPREIMHVLIKENPPDNVGVGGQLLTDRHQRTRAST